VEVLPRKNFKTLQLLRGIAALAVVLFHGLEHTNLKNIFNYGSAGVDLFFIISGFIIMYIHYSDIGKRKSLKSFLYKRFVRIFPTYWIVTISYIALISIFGHNLSIEYILKSFFLVPQLTQPIIGVAWTLEFEILFYIVFCFFILHRKIANFLFYSWAILIIFFFIGPSNSLDNLFLNRILSPLNLEFLFGCGIALLVIKNKIKNVKWTILLGIIGLVLSICLDYFSIMEVHRVIAWGIPFTLIILGLINLEQRREVNAPKFFIYLGNASYSIYLTHLITILLFETLLEKINFYEKYGFLDMIPIIICIFSVSFGCIFYSFIERPLLNFMKLKVININSKDVDIRKKLA